MTDPSSQIHPTAIIEKGAQIGNNVTIEPYAIIKKNVVLEDGVTIKAHAYIDGHTRIGEGTIIYPSAVIGTQTQHLKYGGEKTFVVIGKGCEIREFVTINSSCGEGTTVEVGDNCMIMAYCHIAHNCVVGNNVVMSNNATLAGHVTVGNNAIIGGFTPIHQYVNIGAYTMVGGMSRIPQDIPPYTIGGGIPFKYGGINIIGLKRNDFSFASRRALAQAFRITFRSNLRLDEALSTIEREVEMLPEVEHWINFCKNTKRGLIGLQEVEPQVEENEESLACANK